MSIPAQLPEPAVAVEEGAADDVEVEITIEVAEGEEDPEGDAEAEVLLAALFSAWTTNAAMAGPGNV